MKPAETYQWLMENGGLVIRYRTATELIPPDKAVDIKQLQNDMLQSPQVQTWLENLVPPVLLLSEPLDRTPRVWESGLNIIHGNKPDNFENVIGKLTDFGLKKGVPELDRRTLPYRQWLNTIVGRPNNNIYSKASIGMVADFLAWAGYTQEPAIKNDLIKHLNTVYDFTRKGDYDIHIPGKSKGVKPVIKPELTRDFNVALPMIYDIVGWAAYLPESGTKEELAKADTVIDYIMAKEYQDFPAGYGYMTDESSGRSWSLGWNVQLPGYASISRCYYKSVVHMISLLISFKATGKYPWFKESLAQLEEFQTGDGTYLFPREYLPEEKIGYWVCGLHMGLEENRRVNKAIEVESTFWMAKFHKALKV